MDEAFVYELLKRLYARLDALEGRVKRLELINSLQPRDRDKINFNTIDDKLYEDAKNAVLQAGQASAGILQSHLDIGYARAARLLDMLEANGIIGPANGAKPRDVFIS